MPTGCPVEASDHTTVVSSRRPMCINARTGRSPKSISPTGTPSSPEDCGSGPVLVQPPPSARRCRTPSSRGFLPGGRRQPAEVHGPKAYSYPTTTCGAKSPRSGTDSDLEAFSHYPADGSVAALPGQTAAKTNYLNQRFLSY
ncbi:hypothetical protein N7510_011874 [Penicillium lagena]|nr:hypothetical protein N7510_011862 [Penicillium lagena]KAJ5598918.1 hypothetical protein N7510_011868 [Penicillium lagena]KAJ5598924.1 hypothetical protein N7510_011874 [Penicillium lagena]